MLYNHVGLVSEGEAPGAKKFSNSMSNPPIRDLSGEYSFVPVHVSLSRDCLNNLFTCRQASCFCVDGGRQAKALGDASLRTRLRTRSCPQEELPLQSKTTLAKRVVVCEVKSHFSEQVKVHDTWYQPTVASTNKKNAKAQAATVALQSFGLMPQE